MMSLVLVSTLPPAAPTPSLHRPWLLQTPVLLPFSFSTMSSANVKWVLIVRYLHHVIIIINVGDDDDYFYDDFEMMVMMNTLTIVCQS